MNKKRKRRKLAHSAGFEHYWEYIKHVKRAMHNRHLMNQLRDEVINVTSSFVPKEFLIADQMAIHSMLHRANLETELVKKRTKEFNQSVKKLAKSFGANLNKTGDHYELEEKKTATEDCQEA